MHKRSSLSAILGKTVANHVANFGLRRMGLARKYYEGASAAGIRAGVTGQAHFPKLRRAIGQIAPDVTGLSDYELSKGLTEAAVKKIKTTTNTPVSHHDVMHLFGAKTSLSPERKAVLDKIRNSDEMKKHFGNFPGKPQSVLGKHLKAGIDKVKNEGIESKGGGALRQFARKHFKGPDKQRFAYLPTALEAVHTGGLPLNTFAENSLTHAANKGANAPIMYAKGHVVESGMASVMKKHRSMGQKIKDTVVHAAGAMSPATGEFREFGKDLGRAELHKNKQMQLQRHKILRGKENSIKALQNTSIPKSIGDSITHSGKSVMTNTRIGYRHITHALSQAHDVIGNQVNKVITPIKTMARQAYNKVTGSKSPDLDI